MTWEVTLYKMRDRNYTGKGSSASRLYRTFGDRPTAERWAQNEVEKIGSPWASAHVKEIA